jgi:3-hydroxyacyl-CoA dehydrogenase/enoyl-CoA hydratase/3-hydroxybutyryl-CoA epimerase
MMAMYSPASGPSWRSEQDARGVRTFWLDRPGPALNVVDRAVLDELDARLGQAEADPSIRALVIRSGKASGFCAGADLRAILACRSAAEVEALMIRGLEVVDRLEALALPTVAIVHGVCLGGGLELALACRRRVALASAAPLQMGLPEVQLGLVPAWGGLTRLPRLVGPAEALELAVTGRSIGYLLARSLGIVDRLAAAVDPLDALEIVGTPSAPMRAFDAAAWWEALLRARAVLDDQPGEHLDVQERILSLVAMEIDQGERAVRSAAVGAFAERAVLTDTRQRIVAFLERKQSPAAH